MHLLVYDATGRGPWYQTGLTASWRAGATLYRKVYGVDAVYAATSWEDAFAWLCSVEPGARISSVQYWGHGFFGRAYVGADVLDERAFAVDHPRHGDLVAFRQRLSGEGALLWFRTCSTFGAPRGLAFAARTATFLGCRAAGHTHVIGPLQSGLHSIAPSTTPSWSPDEGVSPALRRRAGRPEDQGGYGAEHASLPSSWTAPHTITCLHGRVPEGW